MVRLYYVPFPHNHLQMSNFQSLQQKKNSQIAIWHHKHSQNAWSLATEESYKMIRELTIPIMQTWQPKKTTNMPQL